MATQIRSIVAGRLPPARTVAKLLEEKFADDYRGEIDHIANQSAK